jgi:hypothetical protein
MEPNSTPGPLPAVSDPVVYWALYYRSLGLPIFPVCPALVSHTHQERTRQGDRVIWQRVTCTKMGKTPLVAWAEYQARVPAEAEVEKWWRQWPGANIGLATGELSGVVVVDLDGDLAVRAASDMGELPAGPFSHTGRVGGQHRFFAWRAEAPTLFSKRSGIDFRGQGGYVILPPSMHVSRAMYRWVWALDEDALADLPRLPDWVVELGGEREVAVARIAGLAGQGTYGWRPMTDIPEGTRDNTLMSIAGRLRGEDGLEEYEIGVRLEAINLEFCKPPVTLADVLRLAHSAAKYAINPPDEKLSGRLEGDPGRTSSQWNLGPTLGDEKRDEVRDEVLEPDSLFAELTLDELRNLSAQHIDWVCHGLVGKGLVTELTAYPKVGKTSLALCLSRALLTGAADFCGQALTAGTIYYVTEEGGGSFRAACARWGVLDFHDGFYTLPQAKLGNYPWSTVIREIRKRVQYRQVDLIVIDTLSMIAGIDDENDAGKAREAMNELRRLANDGYAVLYLRHGRKSGGPVGQAGRGSSAFAGAADILLDLDYIKNDPDGLQPVRDLKAKGRLSEDTPPWLPLILRDGDYCLREDSPPVKLHPETHDRRPLWDQLADGLFDLGCHDATTGVTLVKLARHIGGKDVATRAELKNRVAMGLVATGPGPKLGVSGPAPTVFWLPSGLRTSSESPNPPEGEVSDGVRDGVRNQTEMELE